MSVRKRKWTTARGEQREAWIVDYVDQQGERHVQTFERKKEADEYHATVRVDVSKGTHVPPNKSATVAEAAAVWLKRIEADGRERTTVNQYRQHVTLHISSRLGGAKLSQLSPEKIEGFRDDLLGSGMSRALARKVLTSLKSILKGAKRGDIASGVTIKRVKRDETKIEEGRDMPTRAEVTRIVAAAAPGRQRALLLVLSTCGLRASELRGLRWVDIDLKNAELYVRQRADRFGEIGTPKTSSSTRKIPLAPVTVSALRDWKMACAAGVEYVFPTSTGRVEHHANMLRSVEAVQVKAGVVTREIVNGEEVVTAKYALHAFRHFFASWCLNRVSAGGLELPPNEVQALLGHSSIVMTLDVYGHLFKGQNDDKRLAAAASVLFG